MFIKVDLPEPEAPMIATISPATIVKSTFFQDGPRFDLRCHKFG
ncbi:hypothetical protein [Escherichia coli ISC7]|uniref:Uncharacterized protein n=1 Tax=Escherichia coli ISC7 TaxID=1432555 RepID=W1F0P9_ECOLX|nr:hypothetical protein [Escherichia coli ISC7]